MRQEVTEGAEDRRRGSNFVRSEEWQTWDLLISLNRHVFLESFFWRHQMKATDVRTGYKRWMRVKRALKRILFEPLRKISLSHPISFMQSDSKLSLFSTGSLLPVWQAQAAETSKLYKHQLSCSTRNTLFYNPIRKKALKQEGEGKARLPVYPRGAPCLRGRERHDDVIFTVIRTIPSLSLSLCSPRLF